MKIAAISDTHGHLPDIPPCDIFIHAGDFCLVVNHGRLHQLDWICEKFNPWLDQINAKYKIVIAGNHDLIFTNPSNLCGNTLNAEYLEDSSVTIEGLNIWGSPWTPYFNDWAFNFRQGDHEQAREHWAAIPDDTDILITHGTAHGFCDRVDGVSVGCWVLGACGAVGVHRPSGTHLRACS